MGKKFKIAVLPGDGIGLEIMPQAVNVLKAVAEKFSIDFEFTESPVGFEAYKKHKTCLPDATLSICKKSDAILFGAVGHPEADKLPVDERPERAALLPLRKIFDLYANLRPAIVFKPLATASPLRSDIIGQGFDILIVRELTGDVYFGQPKRLSAAEGVDTMVYKKPEVERIARVAFEAAMKRNKKVCSIDKANVLQASVLWRNVVTETAKNYPKVELQHMYVDNAAMQLVKNPKQFDVILAGNMFGDILSDEAAMLTGSIGMLPSASLNESKFGLFEPIHGSAPDIAGQNKANPIAQILSAAMMCKYSFGLQKEHDAIFAAVNSVLEKDFRTADIAKKGETIIGTKEMGAAIVKEIK
ncbi:MAG: 3-isopropylmalate dehydrogenase [Candidatus Diapherotrites archaeon]|nr:3-isopropylmalate dehydrogenase [Candidatus Diapherotrites archaeon]